MSVEARTDEATVAMMAATQALATFRTALAVHEIPADQLALLLALPPVVEQAVAELQAALERLGVLLALAAGDEWRTLPVERKAAYQTEALATATELLAAGA